MADKSNGDMREALAAFLNQAAAERPARPVTPLAADAPAAPPSPQGPPPGPPTGKEELLAAFDRLVEHEATKPVTRVDPAGPTWKRYLFPAVGMMSAVATVFLWVVQPAWLYPTFEPAPPSTNETEAMLQLVAASILVEQYQEETGRLPTSFADLGLEAPTLSITSDAGGGYRIIGGLASQPMFIRGMLGQPSTLEHFPR